jgi:hypothetical protein
MYVKIVDYSEPKDPGQYDFSVFECKRVDAKTMPEETLEPGCDLHFGNQDELIKKVCLKVTLELEDNKFLSIVAPLHSLYIMNNDGKTIDRM